MSFSSFIGYFTYGQEVRLPLKEVEKKYFFEEITFPSEEAKKNIRSVNAILQDSCGFVWMATQNGLLRYDGHNFKIFRYKPGDTTSLIDTDLLSLYLLNDTILCVGGVHGISLMDVRTKRITNLMYDQDGNPVEYVNAFFRDPDGTVWVAALNGLYSLDPGLKGVINHYLELPPLLKGNPDFAKRVYCIEQHVVDENILMLGTEYGLVSFNKRKNALHKAYPNTEATFWRSSPPVYKLLKDGNYLWARCWISGMPRFDMVNERWENIAYPRENDCLENTSNVWAISDFMLKDEDEIWVCDWDRGLFIFDKNTKKLKPVQEKGEDDVLNKPTMRIFQLKDGSLWLSNGEGLWRQNKRANQFRRLDVPFSHVWVSTVKYEEETGDYYFGLSWQSYGLPVWHSSSGKWTFLQTENQKKEMFSSLDILKDSRNTIWIATQKRGLWYVDKINKRLKAFLPPDTLYPEIWQRTICKIFEDSRKNLWPGTAKDGVVCLSPDRMQAVYYRNNPADSASLISGTLFRAIEEDKDGRIWIGNHSGFCVFDPTTEKFSYEIPWELNNLGIRSGYTYSIVKDTADGMWLTVEGQGLLCVREKEDGNYNFKIYQTENGLKDLSVRHMTKDRQGRLWIVNNGLLYFNPYRDSYMLTDKYNACSRISAAIRKSIRTSSGMFFAANRLDSDG